MAWKEWVVFVVSANERQAIGSALKRKLVPTGGETYHVAKRRNRE